MKAILKWKGLTQGGEREEEAPVLRRPESSASNHSAASSGQHSNQDRASPQPKAARDEERAVCTVRIRKRAHEKAFERRNGGQNPDDEDEGEKKLEIGE